MAEGATTVMITRLVQELQQGRLAARDELITVACVRLEAMVSRQLARFPKVKRYEQTGDVLHMALIRLRRALEQVKPVNSREFFGLASKKIREQLIDLHRSYCGPEGAETHRRTNAPPVRRPDETADAIPPAESAVAKYGDPVREAQWAEFHAFVDSLPEDERELVDLLWYQGLSRAEAAELLGVSEKTISRRWREIRLKIGGWLDQ